MATLYTHTVHTRMLRYRFAYAADTSTSLHLRGHRAPRNDHAAEVAALFLAYLTEHARIATSHARMPSHSPIANTSSWKLAILPPMQPARSETARAPNRRCEAPTRPMLALSATEWSTTLISIMAARWRRSHKPPFTCSHQLPANLLNAGFERRGESVKVSSGYKEGSTSKRCSAKFKAR